MDDTQVLLDFEVLGGNRWYKIWQRPGRAGVMAAHRDEDGVHYSGPHADRKEALEWVNDKTCGKDS